LYWNDTGIHSSLFVDYIDYVVLVRNMWTEIKKENSLSAAKRWKEIIETAGVPTRIMPPQGDENGTYQVYVPRDREHVVREVLKRV
jgi:hypothetical protein